MIPPPAEMKKIIEKILKNQTFGVW